MSEYRYRIHRRRGHDPLQLPAWRCAAHPPELTEEHEQDHACLCRSPEPDEVPVMYRGRERWL